MDNYYNILGIPENATEEEIKKSYKNLSKKYHPDMIPNNLEAEKKFRKINEAYTTLKDPKKREKYNQEIKMNSSRNMQNGSTTNRDVSPIFEDIFEEERREYIQFLDKNEERANRYGRTLKPLKEEAYNLPGIIIYEKKQQIAKELTQLERNSLAFDHYIEFLEENEKRANLCSKSLQEIKVQIKDKRGILSQTEISKYQHEIMKQLWHFEEERKKKIEVLKDELTKKGLDFDAYLAERNLTEETIPTNFIKTAIEAMNLVEKINTKLIPLKIDINQFLARQGKTLIKMKYKELLRIDESLQSILKEKEEVSLEDLLAIENQGKSKKNK